MTLASYHGAPSKTRLWAKVTSTEVVLTALGVSSREDIYQKLPTVTAVEICVQALINHGYNASPYFRKLVQDPSRESHMKEVYGHLELVNRRKVGLAFQQDRLADYLGFPLKPKKAAAVVGDEAAHDTKNTETVDLLAESHSEEQLEAALAKRRRLAQLRRCSRWAVERNSDL